METALSPTRAVLASLPPVTLATLSDAVLAGAAADLVWEASPTTRGVRPMVFGAGLSPVR